MKQPLPFYKMHGAGNDFIMVDGRQPACGDLLAGQIRKICDRRLGIGADGLIILQSEQESGLDFRMTYYNADGSEAELCGNGARCAVAMAYRLDMIGARTNFRSSAGRHEGVVHAADDIEISLPAWEDLQLNLGLEGSAWSTHHTCNTGVPHLIIPVEDIEKIDVPRWGPRLLRHPHFQPQETNVNWVADGDSSADFTIRTFERGVEAETLACGTGACAAAVVMYTLGLATSPVVFRTRSQDLLTVWVDEDAVVLRLRGPAVVSFQGEVFLDE